jgi:hypothetical protein
MSPDDVELTALMRDSWAVPCLNTENYVAQEKTDLCTADFFANTGGVVATRRKWERY